MNKSNIKIILKSVDKDSIEKGKQIVETTLEKNGLAFKGPICIPTKSFLIKLRRSPSGEGAETYDRFVRKEYKKFFIFYNNKELINILQELSRIKNLKIFVKVT